MSASSKERVEKAAPPVRPQGAASVLDFGEVDAQAGDASNEVFDLQQILASVRETAYRWDFVTDRMKWAANADVVFGITDQEEIARGRAFALLVDAEQAGARYDGITGGPTLPRTRTTTTACATACCRKGAADGHRYGLRIRAFAASVRTVVQALRKARSR